MKKQNKRSYSCLVNGCENPRSDMYRRKRFCLYHGKQNIKNGFPVKLRPAEKPKYNTVAKPKYKTVDRSRKAKTPTRVCLVNGCKSNQSISYGEKKFCLHHGKQNIKNGSPVMILPRPASWARGKETHLPCAVNFCTKNRVSSGILCGAHKHQAQISKDHMPYLIQPRDRKRLAYCLVNHCPRTRTAGHRFCTTHEKRNNGKGFPVAVLPQVESHYSTRIRCSVHTCNAYRWHGTIFCTNHERQNSMNGFPINRILPKEFGRGRSDRNRCRVFGCNQFRVSGSLLCSGHEYEASRKCILEDCDRKPFAKGLCIKHYGMAPTSGATICIVDDCKLLVHSDGLCKYHYGRKLNFGDPSYEFGKANASDQAEDKNQDNTPSLGTLFDFIK